MLHEYVEQRTGDLTVELVRTGLDYGAGAFLSSFNGTRLLRCDVQISQTFAAMASSVARLSSGQLSLSASRSRRVSS